MLPGVYLAVPLMLVTVAFVAEDARGMAAVSRGLALVRGRWWPVVGRMAFVAFVVSVPSLTFGFLQLSWDTGISSAASFLSQVYRMFVEVPVLLCAMVVLYRQLVQTHEVPVVAPARSGVRYLWALGALGGLLCVLLGAAMGHKALVCYRDADCEPFFYAEPNGSDQWTIDWSEPDGKGRYTEDDFVHESWEPDPYDGL